MIERFLLAAALTACAHHDTNSIADASVDRDSGSGGSTDASAATTTDAASATATWTSIPAMPTARSELAAVTGHDGRIYVMGGIGTNYLPTVEAYTPSTKTWTEMAGMPTPRAGLTAAIDANGTIYAIGGCNVSGILKTVEAFTPSTNTWRTVTELDFQSTGAGAATGSDGHVYVVNGVTDGCGGPLDITQHYTPTSDTWGDGRSSQITWSRSSAGVVTGSDDRIYAIGGRYDTNCPSSLKILDDVEAYTPATDTWSPVASLSSPRSELASTVGADMRLYAIGGYDGTLRDTVEAYSIVTTTWAAAPSLPTPTRALAAATADGAIYVFGGATSTGSVAFAYVLD